MHEERVCRKKQKAQAEARSSGNNKEKAALAKAKEENATLKKKLQKFKSRSKEFADTVTESKHSSDDEWGEWGVEHANTAVEHHEVELRIRLCWSAVLVLLGLSAGLTISLCYQIMIQPFQVLYRSRKLPKPFGSCSPKLPMLRVTNRKRRRRRLSRKPIGRRRFPRSRAQRSSPVNFCNVTTTTDKNNNIQGGAMDSACTSHMFWSEEGCINLVRERIPVFVAGGKKMWAVGRGTFRRTVLLPNGEKQVFVFRDALLVPDLEYDLISTRRLDEAGYSSTFANGAGVVSDPKGKIVMHAKLHKGLYCISVPVESCATCLSGVDLLHRRYGHASPKYLKQWLKKKDSQKLSFCDACAVMRSRRRPFKHSNNPKSTVKKPLDLCVSDLCGPFRTASTTGAKYFGTIIDIYSRFTFVFFLRTKDEVATHIQRWYAYIKTQTGKIPKVFQSDGGGEYISDDTRATFVKNGTRYTTTAASSSNQNAVAERQNRTLLESARTMMEQAGAYKSLWEEAIRYATFLRNLTPHHSLGMRAPVVLFPLQWMKNANLQASIRVWVQVFCTPKRL